MLSIIDAINQIVYHGHCRRMAGYIRLFRRRWLLLLHFNMISLVVITRSRSGFLLVLYMHKTTILGLSLSRLYVTSFWKLSSSVCINLYGSPLVFTVATPVSPATVRYSALIQPSPVVPTREIVAVGIIGDAAGRDYGVPGPQAEGEILRYTFFSCVNLNTTHQSNPGFST